MNILQICLPHLLDAFLGNSKSFFSSIIHILEIIYII